MDPLLSHGVIQVDNLGSEFYNLVQSAMPQGLILGNFKPKVVLVPSNMDISRLLVSLARENNGEIYVLVGLGTLGLAEIREGDRSTTFRGTYGMTRLHGKCVVPQNGADLLGTEDLHISLIGRDSTVINGSVNGRLVSATPCHLWVATKSNPRQRAAAPPNGPRNLNSDASDSRKRPREEAV